MPRQTHAYCELLSKPQDYKPVGFVWAPLESREVSRIASARTLVTFSRNQQKVCLCSSWKAISHSLRAVILSITALILKQTLVDAVERR